MRRFSALILPERPAISSSDPNAFREIGVAGLLDRADVNEDASSPVFWLVKPYLLAALNHFTVPNAIALFPN